MPAAAAKVSFHSLKKEIDTLSLNPAVKLGLRLAFLAIGLELVILSLAWPGLPPEAPLIYSRPYGQSQLVNSAWLWLLPAVTLIIELVSVRLAAKAGSDHQLWAQLLSWSGTVAAAMSLITLVRIILLVT